MTKPHPIAEAFPMMGKAALAALAADIKSRGLLEPGHTYQGKLLDGRNRLAACKLAGVAFKTVPYKGNDPIGFVVARNDLRRHLTIEQRALAAAKLATLKWGGDRWVGSKEKP